MEAAVRRVERDGDGSCTPVGRPGERDGRGELDDRDLPDLAQDDGPGCDVRSGGRDE